MIKRDPLSWSAAIEQVLREFDRPVHIDELAQRVLAIKTTTAKSPRSMVRSKLQEELGKSVIALDRETFISINTALRGVRFRIEPSSEEIQHQMLDISRLQDFLPWGLRHHPQSLTLLTADGTPITSEAGIQERSPQGRLTIRKGLTQRGVADAVVMEQWFSQHGRALHTIIVTIEDRQPGVLRLEPESKGSYKAHRQQIEQRNLALADLLFELLEQDRRGMLMAHIGVPTAYARLADRQDYPGDPWQVVLKRDSRMHFDGFAIRYADDISPFDALVGAVLGRSSGTTIEQLISGLGDSLAIPDLDPDFDDVLAVPLPRKQVPRSTVTKEQSHKVYRFKASFKHRPKIWREIEVQGGQTLAQLDRTLRTAFGHDPSDHLSGFWKLVRRGKGTMVREVDLGDVNPFGGGSAASVRIAELELVPRAKLKYVYDFGDWIEHTLAFVGTSEQQQGTKYPRVCSHNDPEYQDCTRCKQEGRTRRAVYVCLECSGELGVEQLLCEQCVQEQHEEHYIEEIVY